MRVEPFVRPEWSPLPYDGCVDVVGKVLVHEGGLLVAMLRFGEHATIHEHAGENDTIVACLEGEGFTRVGEETSPLRAGQLVRWPAGIVHGLWTDGSRMTTLMIEQPAV